MENCWVKASPCCELFNSLIKDETDSNPLHPQGARRPVYCMWGHQTLQGVPNRPSASKGSSLTPWLDAGVRKSNACRDQPATVNEQRQRMPLCLCIKYAGMLSTSAKMFSSIVLETHKNPLGLSPIFYSV